MSGLIPIFPLGTVLFPGGLLPLRIFEPRYVDMVGECSRSGGGFGVVLITRGREAGEPAQTVEIGTLGRIVDFQRLPDGLLGITARGERRFRLRRREFRPNRLMVAEVDWLEEPARTPVPAEHAHLAELLRGALEQLGPPYQAQQVDFEDAVELGNVLAGLLPVSAGFRQALLELEDPLERLRVLHGLVQGGAAAGEGGDGAEPGR